MRKHIINGDAPQYLIEDPPGEQVIIHATTMTLIYTTAKQKDLRVIFSQVLLNSETIEISPYVQLNSNQV